MKQLPLEELVSRVLDNDLSAAEFQTLEAILTHSAEARAYYKEQSQLHALMGLECSSTAMVKAPASPVIPMDLVLRRQQRKHIKLAAIAAAAIVLLTLVSLQFYFLKPAANSLVFQTSPGTVYSLSHAGKVAPSAPAILSPGSRLTIEKGTVELKFSSNVSSIVTGPAELFLHDYDKLELSQGSAWFYVPESAVGFRVLTKDLDIIDLGTEFGVHSRSEGFDEVQVITGKIRVSSNHGDTTESIDLIEGGALISSADGELLKSSFTPNSFLSKLPKAQPHIHFSFDQLDPISVSGDLGVNNPISSKKETKLGQVFSQVRGQFGNALQTTGHGAIKTDWSGISGKQARSISYWVKVPRDRSTLQHIAGWGTQGTDEDTERSTRTFYSFLESTSRGMVASLSIGAYWLNGTTPLNDDQWHHVAFVYSGKSFDDGSPDIFCYVDGKLELTSANNLDHVDLDPAGSILVDTDIRDADAQPLYILGQSWYPSPFDETSSLNIDELYIFQGSLSKEEIRNLYHNNSPDKP